MSLEDKLYRLLPSYKKLPDWLKRLITLPFRLLPRRYYLGRNYLFFSKIARDLEFVSGDMIREYQFIKLKGLLEHSFNTVPYYKKKWREYGIDPGKIQSLDDFSRLIPFVTRDEVQQNPEDFVANSFRTRELLRGNSGGTSGVPLALYYLKGYSRAAEWAHMNLQWGRVGFKVGKRMARLRGDYIGKNRLYTFDPWRNYLILNSFKVNRLNADFFLDLLNKYKVEFINAYPSSLFHLTQLSKADRMAVPSLKVILLGSENMFDWQLQKIRDFFEVERIYYWYGHGELCALAGGCEVSDEYHFFPSYGFVEFAPAHSVKNQDGCVEIVGTSLINPAMPLIRYKTQDLGLPVSEDCSCGRKHQRVRKIIGREQEMAVGFNGEKISLTSLIFGRHKGYFNHILKMQIINDKPGKLTVKVIPKESFNDSHKKEIVDTLSTVEGMPFDAAIELVDRMETTDRGKHRFFIRRFHE